MGWVGEQGVKRAARIHWGWASFMDTRKPTTGSLNLDLRDVGGGQVTIDLAPERVTKLLSGHLLTLEPEELTIL